MRPCCWGASCSRRARSRGGRATPLRELSASVYRAGFAALPVTMLVGFLVGIVLTYLSALQLKRYGADLLIINIVGVGVVRELGPMLASIIAAGRSGSAMTAQLGVMRVTEEIEALQVMGVSIITRLVLPKVIALAMALPLVAFCTDLAALAGALRNTLGIPRRRFSKRCRARSSRSISGSASASRARSASRSRSSSHYGLKVLPNTDSLAAGVTAPRSLRRSPASSWTRFSRSCYAMSADPTEYAIEVEGLVNAVGAGQILHQNLNLKVRRDEVMTLIGGSGSGKTQLAEGDPRIEAPGRGSVRVFSVSWHDPSFKKVRDARRRMGMLFQNGALFPR